MAKLLLLAAVIAANAALLTKPAQAQREDTAGQCYTNGNGDCVCSVLIDMPSCNASLGITCHDSFPEVCN
jgi:hypothetical protein